MAGSETRPRFAIHDMWQKSTSHESAKTVGQCLFAWFDHFRNREHVQARVYTCRSWRTTQGKTADPNLVAVIEGELARGEAVRLFTFDSDADMRSDNLLLPLSAPERGGRGA